MTKQGLIENVKKNLAMAEQGFAAAIARAALDPTEEALREIDWYERRMQELNVLSCRVTVHVPEDQ